MLNTERLISCTSWGDPPTATSQAKGICLIKGKPRMFNKKNVTAAKNTLAARFAQWRPAMQYDFPVHVKVFFVFGHPTSHRKAVRETTIPKPKRPDLDNLVKLFLDAISPMYFKDDNIVVELTVGKYWGPRPGIMLEIWR